MPWPEKRLVATGFGKTERCSRERVAGLIHAAEAAPDGVRKLGAVLRKYGLEGEIPVILTLGSEQLDLALGRPNVVHAALLAGPATDTFLARYRRLERFRSGDRRA